MRLPLGDVIDGFPAKSRECQLQALGRILQSEYVRSAALSSGAIHLTNGL